MTGNLGQYKKEPRKGTLTIEERKEVCLFNRKCHHDVMSLRNGIKTFVQPKSISRTPLVM